MGIDEGMDDAGACAGSEAGIATAAVLLGSLGGIWGLLGSPILPIECALARSGKGGARMADSAEGPLSMGVEGDTFGLGPGKVGKEVEKPGSGVLEADFRTGRDGGPGLVSS